MSKFPRHSIPASKCLRFDQPVNAGLISFRFGINSVQNFVGERLNVGKTSLGREILCHHFRQRLPHALDDELISRKAGFGLRLRQGPCLMAWQTQSISLVPGCFHIKMISNFVGVSNAVSMA